MITAISLSRHTLRVIFQNLGWAFGCNAAALPLAAFGMLSTLVAGAVMAFSSVSVAANSLRLRAFAPQVPAARSCDDSDPLIQFLDRDEERS